MSKGEKVKCTKEKKKVRGWSIEEMKDKVNSRFEIRHRRNDKMERFDSGRDGSMLENLAEKVEAEVLDKFKIENSKREAFKAQAPCWSGGGCAKARNTEHCKASRRRRRKKKR